MTAFLVGWYLFWSLAAFLRFATDKRAAARGRRRVPERSLHLLELLGGFPGAFLAIVMLRHKNRKPSFLAVSLLAALGNLLTLTGLLLLTVPGLRS